MALGRRDPQRGIFDSSMRFRFDLDKLGLYGKLAEHGATIFKDDDFAALYKRGGRPSAPPSQKAIALLLQHYEGISDDEVIQRARFDLRWKTALDLDPLSLTAPFVKSTFQAFRVGLVLNEQEGIAFEESLARAVKAGVFPRKLGVALDSSPVRGRGAVKDTFNLLADAVRNVIRSIAEKTGREPKDEAERVGVGRHFEAPSVKGSESIDWTNEDEKRAFLGRLLADCDRVVGAARTADCGGESVELLEKIVEQNVDRTTEPPSIPQKVAKDRVVSVADPEIRHGHKSSGKIFSGHKAHIAVEVTTGLITAVEIGKPGEADGAKVAELIKRTNEVTGSKVEEALGDCAYSSAEAQKQAAEVEVGLRTKMPGPRAGQLGPAEFTVSVRGDKARCPAGHSSAKKTRDGDALVHQWDPALCAACPFKTNCTDAASRTLKVGPDFHDRRRREKWARSKKGRAVLRERVVVEHAIGAMKNLGAGGARFFGRSKTKLQWLWTAAVVNLLILFRLGVGEVESAGAAA